MPPMSGNVAPDVVHTSAPAPAAPTADTGDTGFAPGLSGAQSTGHSFAGFTNFKSRKLTSEAPTSGKPTAETPTDTQYAPPTKTPPAIIQAIKAEVVAGTGAFDPLLVSGGPDHLMKLFERDDFADSWDASLGALLAAIDNKFDTDIPETKVFRRCWEYIQRASDADWCDLHLSKLQNYEKLDVCNKKLKGLRGLTLINIADDDNNHEAVEQSKDIYKATMALDGNKISEKPAGARILRKPRLNKLT